ncbi:Not1 N-terminal domain, CCR4-Not complex component-domain-containing protein [Piptocephalis cylindrospora]|uniref:General negative regulator of transcription subunit n=1 Tax=Piptocephalis cylindrospora TaxID=1907219 RepID=A0A4P9Y8A2_9FUNG|nr:Not1 N-terminal domain, CCR4-Not complex component-domain-containing protein [Piptocephalis cylindrospora]|eukprot:RKP15022.1 Not1 N-terminal domain, CCR4-Not complex component-domain-containing protein [Piptocephalis cylindrospora]
MAQPLISPHHLLAEIDRVIKKVDEGIEGFVELMDKMHTTTNPSQKEKLEGESKREIKKLQRLRDQIKTWQTSNEIKDKNLLNQYRRRIEEQMETFKVVEKELKTKAFSKEGLNLAAKVDPKDREKQELASWITAQVEALTTQVERAEAEQEILQAQGRKSKRDTSKAARIDELEHWNERRKWHCSRLELCQRLIQNGALAMDRFRDIKDDIEYYVESNEDPDFEEDEEIYTALGLEDEEDAYLISSEIFGSGSGPGGQPGEDEDLPESFSSASSSSSEKRSDSFSSGGGMECQSPSKISVPSVISDIGVIKTTTPSRSSSSTSSSVLGAGSKKEEDMTSPATVPTTVIAPAPDVSGKKGKESTGPKLPSALPPTTGKAVMIHEQPEGGNRKKAATIPSVSISSQSSKKVTPRISIDALTPSTSSSTSPSSSSAQTKKAAPLTPGKGKEPQGKWASPSSPAIKTTEVKGSVPPSPIAPTRVSTYSQTVQSGLDLSAASSHEVKPSSKETRTPSTPVESKTSAHDSSLPIHHSLHSILGDLVPQFEKAQKDALSLERIISEVDASPKSAYLQLPKRGDLLRSLPKYTPAQPFPNPPPYYPAQPPPMIPDAFYATVDLDTLFFIFYYRPASYEQYRAAKEIKRRGWRFNTKQLAWFLRASSTSTSPSVESGEQAPPLPRQVTDTYEQGVYDVFDYEGAWCKRKKADFR